ncbi:unnamed protein product [Phaedon cochleariae]|uniref:Uncharacterized protein n=1 Tax=Phaedon cochleariae TaxID=80249 RepID=A0A9N9SG02_PHACE|nr:unnamed protein product [Phaedon cochleariae]
MELNECLIEYPYHSETLYCTDSEVADNKKYFLLGFKDSIPVICNNMLEEKVRTPLSMKNKVLKVEVDPQTGDKFINLNGRKIKIPESKTPVIPKTEQNIHNMSAGPQPIKFKIIRGFPLPKSHYTSLMLDKTNVDSATISVNKIMNLNSLSQKSLIISSEVHSVKSPDSSNMTIKPYTQTSMCEADSYSYLGKQISCRSSSTITSDDQHVGALDLTNYSVKLDNTNDGESASSDKSCQTDISWYSNNVNARNNVAECGVQTEDPGEEIIDDLAFLSPDVDIEYLLNDLEHAPMKHILPKKILNCSPLYTPPESLFELESSCQNSQKNIDCKTSPQSHSTANNFFHELRTALIPDDKGNMPIHIGVLRDDLKTVKKCWLILKILQQSVDLPNNSDFTPLQLAVTNMASCDVIDYLLSKGASLEAIDSEGNNILHLAIEYRRTDALASLLRFATERDFNLDQHNHEGLTPLMIACLNGQNDSAKLLLDFKADVNARDHISGRTSLFHAAENHDVEMVQMLLMYQAETKLKNFFGTSPHDAMYEIEDMPDQIKCLIWGKSNKRKAADEPKTAKVMKKEEPMVRKVGLKTYPKYQKIEFPDVSRRLSVVK